MANDSFLAEIPLSHLPTSEPTGIKSFYTSSQVLFYMWLIKLKLKLCKVPKY